MSAYQRFSLLAEAAERIRPADRKEWARQLDEAAGAAMDEAEQRDGWNGAAAVYYEWVAVPRPVVRSDSLSHLPERVQRALGESTYRRIEEEISACRPN